MKASLNASEEEIIMVTIIDHPPHITHYLENLACGERERALNISSY